MDLVYFNKRFKVVIVWIVVFFLSMNKGVEVELGLDVVICVIFNM